MNLDQAIAGRRSVREYKKQAVDERTIERLILAAVLAPNAVNLQPWTFTVVRDQQVLDQVSRESKQHLRTTLPEGARTEHFRAMLDDPDYHIFYHAPALVLISGEAEGPWIVEDCSLAAENLMLSAHAAGLGTCWIGFAQSYLNTAEGKKLLGLPAAWVPVAPIILGHPKSPSPPVPRKAPEIRWVG
jgi:nitroreductase